MAITVNTQGGYWSNIRSYYLTDSMKETKNAILINGLPCDKYSLSEIPVRKDRMPSYPSAPWLNASHYDYWLPFTQGRLYLPLNPALSYFIPPYRNPYPTAQTLFRNSYMNSKGEEFIPLTYNYYDYQAKFSANGRLASIVPYQGSTGRMLNQYVDIGNDKCLKHGPSGSYSLANYYNQLTLMDTSKDAPTFMNFGLTTYGYIHNVIGISTNGNIIAVALGQTSLNYVNVTTLNIVKITPAGVGTVLKSIQTHGPATATTPSVPSYIIEPGFSQDMKTMYFVASTQPQVNYAAETYKLGRITIDIPNETVTDPAYYVMKLPDGTVINTGTTPDTTKDNKFPVQTTYYSYYSATYHYWGGMVIPFVFDNVTYLAVVPLSMAGRGLTGNSQAYYSSIWSNVKAVLYKVDEVNNCVTLCDTNTDIFNYQGAEAAFPLSNNRTVVACNQSTIWTFTADPLTDKFKIIETLANRTITALGIDELDRVWICGAPSTSVPPTYEIYLPSKAITITVDFVDTNVMYINADIDSNLRIKAQDASGARMAVSVRLVLEGNAVFKSNGLKTIDVMTLTTDDLLVPFTIKGDGYVNVFSGINF